MRTDDKKRKQRIEEKITNLNTLGILPADEVQLNIDVIYNSILNNICSVVPINSPRQVVSDFLKSITIYGPEVKFYSLNVYTNNQFETAVSGLYCVGDGAGITRGIMQAATTGYIAAEDIIEKNKRRKPNK